MLVQYTHIIQLIHTQKNSLLYQFITISLYFAELLPNTNLIFGENYSPTLI